MKSRLYRALLVGRFFAFATFTINLASWKPEHPAGIFKIKMFIE